MNKLREERDLTEEECAELREQLEAQEELAFRLRKEIENLRRSGVLTTLKFMHVLAMDIKKYNIKVAELNAQREEALKTLDEHWGERYVEKEAELETEREKVHAFLTMQDALHDTLTNHKREVLLEHKVQSTVLQNELAEVFDKKEALQDRHDGQLKAMGLMEGQIRQLEVEMQELTRQSVIKDGKVDVALSKKKKRVDRDLDAMIIKIQEQRDKIAATEKMITDVEDSRVEKEEELKYVEAQLVNTLVEQQRKLMQVLQSVRVDAEEYGLDMHMGAPVRGEEGAGQASAPGSPGPTAADALTRDVKRPASMGNVNAMEESKGSAGHGESFDDDDGFVVDTGTGREDVRNASPIA